MAAVQYIYILRLAGDDNRDFYDGDDDADDNVYGDDDDDDKSYGDFNDGDLYIIGAVCVSVSKSHYLCIQRIYFSWWEFCFSFLKYFFLIFFKFLF